MPELPEVQAIADALGERAVDRTIDRLQLLSFAALKTFDPPVDAVRGAVIRSVTRRGKFLVIGGGDLSLVIHLARAGWVRWHDQLPGAARPSPRGPVAAELRLTDGAGIRFTEQGTERRLAIYVVRDITDVPGVARLGIDVLDPGFDVESLRSLLKESPGHLKSTLSDQSILAGIGNAYSDDILHAARLSPFKTTTTLDDVMVERLHSAIRSTIGDAISRSQGLGLTDLKANKKLGLRVHGHDGDPCPVCGDRIRSVYSAQRSFQYCPTCQTGGKVLADRRLSKLLR